MHTIEGTLTSINIRTTRNPELTKIGLLLDHDGRSTWYNAFSKSDKQIKMYRNLDLNQKLKLVLNVDNFVMGIQ